MKYFILLLILFSVSCTEEFESQKVEVTFGFSSDVNISSEDYIFITLISDTDLRTTVKNISIEMLKCSALKVNLYKNNYTLCIFVNNKLFISQDFNITESKLYLINV